MTKVLLICLLSFSYFVLVIEANTHHHVGVRWIEASQENIEAWGNNEFVRTNVGISVRSFGLYCRVRNKTESNGCRSFGFTDFTDPSNHPSIHTPLKPEHCIIITNESHKNPKNQGVVFNHQNYFTYILL